MLSCMHRLCTETVLLLRVSKQAGQASGSKPQPKHPDLKHGDMSRLAPGWRSRQTHSQSAALDALADRCLRADSEPRPHMVQFCAKVSELHAVACQQNASLFLACSPTGPWLSAAQPDGPVSCRDG